LQINLEEISEENSNLEHDFENEITKKNVNKKEIGQIINAVNNITIINRKLNQDKQKNKSRKQTEDKLLSETSDNLIDEMAKRLTDAAENIGDLVAVFEDPQLQEFKEQKNATSHAQSVDPKQGAGSKADGN
jgi:hypothetical protein